MIQWEITSAIVNSPRASTHTRETRRTDMLTSSHQQRQQQIQVDNKAPPKGTNGTTEIPSLLLRLVQLLLASKGDVQETQVLASFEYAMRLLNRYSYHALLPYRSILHQQSLVPVKDSRRDPYFGHGQKEAYALLLLPCRLRWNAQWE